MSYDLDPAPDGAQPRLENRLEAAVYVQHVMATHLQDALAHWKAMWSTADDDQRAELSLVISVAEGNIATLVEVSKQLARANAKDKAARSNVIPIRRGEG